MVKVDLNMLSNTYRKSTDACAVKAGITCDCMNDFMRLVVAQDASYDK